MNNNIFYTENIILMPEKFIDIIILLKIKIFEYFFIVFKTYILGKIF